MVKDETKRPEHDREPKPEGDRPDPERQPEDQPADPAVAEGVKLGGEQLGAGTQRQK